ncbi:MAG: leucyl aminopeptidase [Microbacterium sp.]|nr:leucyl aminopeptidase [Microbacterium sp.]
MSETSIDLLAPAAVPADRPLVLGVVPGDDGPAVVGTALRDGLDTAAASIGLTGTLEEVARIPDPAGTASSILLVGLGASPDPASLRRAAGAAVRRLAGAGAPILALPVADAESLRAVVEGALLGGYAFRGFRGLKPEREIAPTPAVVVNPAIAGDAAATRAIATADAVALVKTLVHTPPNHLFPASMADLAVEAAGDLDLDVRIMDENALADGGFGGLIGVGQGSPRGPRLVRVGWAPDGAQSTVALVGKGITFDTGGNSLKPAASMIGMKYDMTGAATVLAVAIAAARMQLPIAVTAWLCLAENMPGPGAMRPHDVIRIRNGATVEVLNTDAEGRLVLADGLSAAGEEHPDLIIDVATLTGAAKTAMGTRHVATMGDAALGAELVAAGELAGESLWPMPLPDEMRSLLDSEVADIANVKPGNTAGGMLIAGVFLREFAPTAESGEPVPWAHLDIANAAWTDGGAQGFTTPGPTGVMVRTLIRFLEQRTQDLPASSTG